MRITEVEPILLRGGEAYGSRTGADEATDNGDWQLLIRVATDEGLTGWADVETLAPAAVAIIAGQGVATLGFLTLGGYLVCGYPPDYQPLVGTISYAHANYRRDCLPQSCRA